MGEWGSCPIRPIRLIRPIPLPHHSIIPVFQYSTPPPILHNSGDNPCGKKTKTDSPRCLRL